MKDFESCDKGLFVWGYFLIVAALPSLVGIVVRRLSILGTTIFGVVSIVRSVVLTIMFGFRIAIGKINLIVNSIAE